MAVPYSDDLRQKVTMAVDKGMRKSEVSRVFNVSRKTIDLWIKRRERTGEDKASSGYQKGSRHKIIDWEGFREFATANRFLTTTEMAETWKGEISRHTISRALKKINFTRKKRHTVTEKEMSNIGNNSKLISNKKTQDH